NLNVPGPAAGGSFCFGAAEGAGTGANICSHFGHFTRLPGGTAFAVFSVTPQSVFGHLYETDIKASPLGSTSAALATSGFRLGCWFGACTPFSFTGFSPPLQAGAFGFSPGAACLSFPFAGGFAAFLGTASLKRNRGGGPFLRSSSSSS